MAKLTAQEELEQRRAEKAFSDADTRLNQEFKERKRQRDIQELRNRFAERNQVEEERKAKREEAKQAKERKADPLYDERKAARAKAEKGAVTKMVGGVKVTEYPAVDEVERRPTAQGRGGRSEGISGGSLLRQMNPQKLYKTGGRVRTASQRADGIAIRGKTRA